MKEFKVSVKTESIFDWVKLIVGIIALFVGLAGLLLPVLPGWILIFVGLELIGIKLVFIDKIKEYALKKLNSEKSKAKNGNATDSKKKSGHQ